jgi:hypothetical protein
MAIVPVTMIASQMLPFIIIGGLFFHITGLITLGIYCYLILLVFQLITLAGGVRCLAARKNHFAANGDHAAGRRSRRREQGAERRRAHLRGRVHRAPWAICSG